MTSIQHLCDIVRAVLLWYVCRWTAPSARWTAALLLSTARFGCTAAVLTGAIIGALSLLPAIL
jgi:hypothetical protein